jgi:hypothetical protein
MGFALAHPKQPPLHHLEGISFQVDQNKEQPILGCGQRTVRIGRVPAGGTRLPIEPPCDHMRLERAFKRRDQLPKLLHGETDSIKPLCGADLEIGEP